MYDVGLNVDLSKADEVTADMFTNVYCCRHCRGSVWFILFYIQDRGRAVKLATFVVVQSGPWGNIVNEEKIK